MPVDEEEEVAIEGVVEETPKVPLGTYAPFDVSDQKEWTKEMFDREQGGKLKLAENLRAMVEAACRRESLGRRLEIGQAWRLQLMDRGFHRLIPRKGGGWNIAFQGASQGYDVYGGAALNNLYDLNIIGVHNDIIVNALNREQVKTEFDPKTDGDDAVTASAKANKLKVIIAQEAEYRKRQSEAARTFCTDERCALLMTPTADALTYGFEKTSSDAVPETEETAPEGGESKQPSIRTRLRVFGKLEHKCQIANDDGNQSPYQILAWEEDTASERATFPWIAKEIQGGSAGIAEIELDRVARSSIKLAIQGGMVTGQGAINDSTRLQCWLTPKFYWDDSCSEDAREWFLENFPKGILAVYSSTPLAFARSESWSEVLTIMHARSGKGQNRRALTEAYSGANMILNNLVDLICKFFTSTVPRVFYDDVVFNVPQLRQSGNTPGRKEPFNGAKVNPNSTPILTDPMPTHQPSLPDFIHWLSGDLAQLLTGAQLTLQGANNVDGDQGTLGEAELDNDSAMTRLSEPWVALRDGFSNATLQAVRWNARVQPKGKVFDRITRDMGRIRVEMKELNSDLLVVADNDSNIPESFTEREERVWKLINMIPANPFITSIMTSPANARVVKDAARMGITIGGADSWEKQEGEFSVLLDGKPLPNPQLKKLETQIAQLKIATEQGAQTLAQDKANGIQPPEEMIQKLEEGIALIQQLMQQMQAIQQQTPLVSSVPVRGDGSEEDAIEMACCFAKMISPEGRRLATSKNKAEIAAFANLHLHWYEHQTAAKAIAKQNQQPVEPKVSITAALDKMPPQWQATMLSKMDVAVDPAQAEEMGPHLVTHEVKGVNASGAEETIKTELSGKQLD
jgi:hypothetical protein